MQAGDTEASRLDVQRRKIGETDTPFGVGTERGEVGIGANACRAVATAHGDQRASFRIAQRLVQLIEALPIVTCEVAPPFEQAAAPDHPVTLREPGETAVEQRFVEGAGRRYDAQPVAW